MKLKKLIKDIPFKDIKGSKEIEITGLCVNSKLAAPGQLFVAKKGVHDDGSKYISEAIMGGAVAILSDLYDPSLKEITQLIDPDVSKKEALLAATFYQFPSDELYMVGITGTNGKTTTSFLVKYLLDKLNEKSGLIGTIEYIIGSQRYSATRTTPDVISNHKMLREMVSQGCKSAVMEVTSHALHQNRVEGIEFDAAIFTNLSLDHLDYHKTMEQYAEAKNKLFRMLNSSNSTKKRKFPKAACINIDSPWAAKMMEGVKAPILTFGCSSKADLQADEIYLTPEGTHFTLKYQGKKEKAFIPVVGRYNVYNALGSLAVLLSKGVPLEILIPFLSTFPAAPGRMELVKNPLNLKIFVDFAHSDDALINVLECLNEFKKGKVIVIFGCGGDRDKLKRPKMAEAVEELADFAIITNDNPRSEEPESIQKDILKGFKKKNYIVELDRKKAIEKAIDMASGEDIILIAGKGHENYQIFAHKTCEFDDRKVAFELASQKAHALV